MRRPRHVHHICKQSTHGEVTAEMQTWHQLSSDMNVGVGGAVLPPVWFLRMVTHLHCSTLASLLLDPNTVLGPMNLLQEANRVSQNVCEGLEKVVFECTYAALFHTMTSLSSPPEARYSPLLDQRTQFTQAARDEHKPCCSLGL